MKKSKNTEAKHVDHDMFVNKDGFSDGGVEIKVSKPNETQDADVKGQRSVLAEKKRKAKWY